MRKANIIVSIALIVIASVLLIPVSKITKVQGVPLGPSFFPYVTLGLIIGLSLVVLGNTIRNKETNDKEFMNKSQTIKVGITFALFFTYISIMEQIGFVISTAIFIFALGGFFYGKVDKTLIKIGAFSIIAPIALFQLFSNLFNVVLP